MRYTNLQQMIKGSSSIRRYFLSLPANIQSALHSHDKYIHTAEELHRRVHEIQAYERQISLSEHYFFSSKKS